MKPLCLLSFSLAFLTQGIANNFAYEETRERYSDEEYDDDYDQEISFDDDDYLSDAESPNAPMQSNSEPQECLSPYHRMHVSARHNESKGIGYHRGYTTIEAFGIYDGWSSHFMPFLDLRGHVFNNGKLAGNVGVGERTVISSWSHTFGSYLYYDVRGVGRGLTVNQLSPGLELVGRRMEYRINGYFPLGKDKTRKYHRKFDEFEGHNIILKSKQQRALRGGDAEVGVHITQSTKYDLYAAAGPYYLHSSHANSWGGRTRLLGRYKEYVSLEVAYSYDTLFRSIVQGSVAVTLPFGRKLKRTGEGCPQANDLLLSRASFAPSRFEIPVVKKIHRKEKAINPATGKPWTVWFVDNTSSSNGTFESPFPTLLQAQNASSPNDMIYVFPGDGTTKGMSQGITLQNAQSFFASGIKHKFPTTKGTMTIPKFSSTNPTITNTAGDVVTLGSGDIVSGFTIISTGAFTGINSPMAGINGATIASNIITSTGPGTTNNGINVNGVGVVNIDNNLIILPQRLATPSGITVTSVGGTMSGEINDNSIIGFGFGITLSADDFEVKGNTIINAQVEAIQVNLLANTTVKIIGNTIRANIIDVGGMLLEDAPNTISGNIVIKDNNLDLGPSYANGITFFTENPNNWNMNVDISNNYLAGVVVNLVNSTCIGVVSSATNTICLTLDNNIVVNQTPTVPAFLLDTTAGGIINVDSIDGNVGVPVAFRGTGINFIPEDSCGN